MHILPPLETVKDIAATQQYDVLPLSCEILSDFITPIEAMRILKNVSTHCYMLESAQADDRWGRYTFLGFDPKLEITCIDGKMKAGGLTVRTDDPSQYLRELLSSYRSPRFDYLPSFTGGLVGYFSYDYLKYSEPSVRCGEQDEDSFKDVDLMLFDKVIAFDHVRQKIVLIVNMALSDVEVGYNKAKLELEQLVSLLKTGEKKQEAPGAAPRRSHAALLQRAVLRDGRNRQAPHPRGRYLSDRTLEPPERTVRGEPARYLPRAAHHQSLAVHVLLFRHRR